ncbi:MAG: hypothetical protein FWB96_07670 [Defluviitaleaceae bacterium]|nr:hypothetical protein [Defluviitaleaceae bacterium]MCL2262803.1 hypothetical protein [Defluviitaleaceae bacterium]
MKRFFAIFTAFVMLFGTMVFAAEAATTTAAEATPENGTVVLTYEEAVELALADMLAITDIEIAIRDLQVHRIWFRDELRRIDSGRGTLQIRAMQEMLWDLDAGITAAQTGQQALSAMTGAALNQMQTGIAGIADPNAPPEQVAGLQASLTGLFAMSTPDLSGQVTALQGQRSQLMHEIARLNRPEEIAELRRDVQRNMNELDRQTTMLEMGREQAELSVEYILRSLIVAQAELDSFIESFTASLALQEMNLTRMTVMHQVGMLSTHDFNAAKHGLSQARTQLEEMKRTRQTLMQSINHLLGQPLEQDTVIEFEREFHETPEDLTAHIEAAITETHTIRSLQLDVERASDARWVYTGNRANVSLSESERRRAHNPNRITQNIWSLEQTDEDEEIESLRTRIALQEAFERAETNHEQTIRQMEANLLRAYTELEALHTQYEAQQADHARALENLEVAITNLALGLITQFEVEGARLAVFAAEQEKDLTLTRKWALSFRLENPTLLQN